MSGNPYDTLSAEEMAILKAHYVMVKDCATQEQLERALKGWTNRQRLVVARLLDKVRDSGWMIDGQYPSGSLRFRRRLASKTDQVMALSDEDFERYRRGELVFVDGQLSPVSC